ncbi:MAG: hypothetical protein AB7O38_19890 [Pirellulaceae bacterium]
MPAWLDRFHGGPEVMICELMRTYLRRYLWGLVVGAWWLGAGSSRAESPPVVEVPSILSQHAAKVQAMRGALAQRKFAESERLAKEALALVPFDERPLIQQLRAEAAQGKTEAALASLARLLERGGRDKRVLRADPYLKELTTDIRFSELLDRPPPPHPSRPQAWSWRTQAAPPAGRDLPVTEANTGWQMQLGMFVTVFDLRSPPMAAEVVLGREKIAARLNAWYRDGTAAGHRGDIYDNADDDHSPLDMAAFPQMVRTRYGDSVRQHEFHRGLQTRFLYAQVNGHSPTEAVGGTIVGNSSTAVVDSTIWRSMPRLAYGDPASVQRLYAQYAANHLYVYPEHQDHDPGHNGTGGGYGDVYPANTPYLLISQGSSGSDQPLLEAVVCTLGAFHPEVKRRLQGGQALMPTVQMIFRRSYGNVTSDEAYLSGAAHPSVFEGSQVNGQAMVELAHRIDVGSEPPLVRLKVLDEDRAQAGRDYFAEPGAGEVLFDTPCAIGRVYRTTQASRRMVVSAEPSTDLNGKPLTYHWVVLRGDPARVTITPLDERSSTVELKVGYHERRPIAPGSALESNRVDVGAFVHNGHWYSAPAFVTHFFLDHESRVYDSDGRLQQLEYSDGNYVDPLLDVTKAWRDTYRYDPQGKCLGW